jgi:hypothetical protein
MTNKFKELFTLNNRSCQNDKIDSIHTLETRIIEEQRILSISLANTDNLLYGLKLCLESCLKVSGMDCGGIYIFDDTTGNLSLRVHKGLKKDFVNSALVHDKDSPNVSLVKKGKPIYTLTKQLKVVLNKDQHNEGLKTLATIPCLIS